MPKNRSSKYIRLSPAQTAERDRKIAKLWLVAGLSARQIALLVGLSHQGVVYRLRVLRLDKAARERYRLSVAEIGL
jgi:hypothetical protein